MHNKIDKQMRAFVLTMDNLDEPKMATMIRQWRAKFECLYDEIDALHTEDIKKAYTIMGLEGDDSEMDEPDPVEWMGEDKVKWVDPAEAFHKKEEESETVAKSFGRQFEKL